MELVNRNSHTFWVPVSNHETSTISSYAKWEIAFRVFSNIYSTEHPSKAPELLQVTVL